MDIPSDIPPEHFSALIRHGAGSFYACDLTPAGLRYRDDESSGATPLLVHPGNQEWGRFMRTLYGLGAHTWQQRYLSPAGSTPGDGTHWRLAITSPALTMEAEGHSAYPPNFTLALDAIRRLLGDRDFF